MTGRRGPDLRRVALALSAAAGVLAGGPVGALAEEADPPGNYTFDGWVGSAYNRLDESTIAILRLPLSVPLQRGEDGKVRVKLLLHAGFGWQNFQFDLDRPELPDHLEVLTVVPGVEVTLSPTPSWTLRPVAQLGVGKDLNGGPWTVLSAAGSRSSLVLPWAGRSFTLGNRLMGAVQYPAGGYGGRGFVLVEGGLDARLPLRITWRGRDHDVRVFLIATWFADVVDLFRPPQEAPAALRAAYQVGFSFGADEPFSIWKAHLPRIGAGLVLGNAGLLGVRVNTGFPF